MNKQLPPPRSSIASLLLELILKKDVRETDLDPFNGFRDALSELRNYYKIPIRHIDVKGVSKFGKPCKYRRHYLLTINRKRAIRVYLKLNPEKQTH
jgi:hypothetical protein